MSVTPTPVADRVARFLGAKARDRIRPISRLGEEFGSKSSVGDERANGTPQA
jgi:hypothetical protein